MAASYQILDDYFAKQNLKYLFDQLKLDKEIQKHVPDLTKGNFTDIFTKVLDNIEH